MFRVMVDCKDQACIVLMISYSLKAPIHTNKQYSSSSNTIASGFMIERGMVHSIVALLRVIIKPSSPIEIVSLIENTERQ